MIHVENAHSNLVGFAGSALWLQKLKNQFSWNDSINICVCAPLLIPTPCWRINSEQLCTLGTHHTILKKWQSLEQTFPAQNNGQQTFFWPRPKQLHGKPNFFIFRWRSSVFSYYQHVCWQLQNISECFIFGGQNLRSLSSVMNTFWVFVLNYSGFSDRCDTPRFLHKPWVKSVLVCIWGWFLGLPKPGDRPAGFSKLQKTASKGLPTTDGTSDSVFDASPKFLGASSRVL